MREAKEISVGFLEFLKDYSVPRRAEGSLVTLCEAATASPVPRVCPRQLRPEASTHSW